MKVTAPIASVLLLLSVAAAEDPPAADPGWPRELSNGEAKVVLYQPQIESWERFGAFKAKAVVSIDVPGRTESGLGVVYLEAKTVTDMQSRVVVLYDIKATAIRFPQDNGKEVDGFRAIVQSVLPHAPVTVSLDRILAAVERDKRLGRDVRVNSAPPPIFYSPRPAILLQFLGEPILEPIKGGSGLRSVVNTNWDVLSPGDGVFYLRVGSLWLTAPDLIKGPWTRVESTPAALQHLPADDAWKEARAALKAPPADAVVPSVIVSTEPAELIVTAGPPRLKAIEGTQLAYMQNSESDLFRHAGKEFYLLVAGRWFSASALKGPWQAAGKLPADFARIPAEHERARVLASVAGTPDAKEAAIMATIPQRASVKKAAQLEVTSEYDGEPELAPVEGTSVEYVVNTQADVFRLSGRYYLCTRGMWFESASAAGPWALCGRVPEALYEIPATHPKHHVSYVRLYGETADSYVFGYTAGYSGMYLADGVVVWGTGWTWPYWHRRYGPRWSRYYRFCAPGLFSYGRHARYVHRYGAYVCRDARYGPYGGVAGGAVYFPTRGYVRASVAWGAVGPRKTSFAYLPAWRTAKPGLGPASAYTAWGKTVTRRNDRWARARSQRGAPTVRSRSVTGRNNLYVGPNGAIYRREPNGRWQRRAGGNTWRPAPAAPRARRPIDREYQRRQRGQAQTRRYTAPPRRANTAPPPRRANPPPSRGGGGGRGRR